MAIYQDQLKDMLEPVARALGEDLLPRVVFVRGSTTALLITDPVSLEGVRYTEDVDLIVDVKTRGQWVLMMDELRKRGFSESPEDAIICRMRYQGLIVDFMPDDKSILGFTNRWYRDSIETAENYQLASGVSVRILTPPYFMATKLEAWLGRGNNSPLESHDLEDVINVVDGRAELVDELAQAKRDVRNFVAIEINRLLQMTEFEYLIQGSFSSEERARVVFDRLERISMLSDDNAVVLS